MTTANIALAAVDPASRPTSLPSAAATMMVTDLSALSSLVAAQDGDQPLHWHVTALGGPVWVQMGADPTAGPGEGHLVCDGVPRSFPVENAGERLALVRA